MDVISGVSGLAWLTDKLMAHSSKQEKAAADQTVDEVSDPDCWSALTLGDSAFSVLYEPERNDVAGLLHAVVTGSRSMGPASPRVFRAIRSLGVTEVGVDRAVGCGGCILLCPRLTPLQVAANMIRVVQDVASFCLALLPYFSDAHHGRIAALQGVVLVMPVHEDSEAPFLRHARECGFRVWSCECGAASPVRFVCVARWSPAYEMSLALARDALVPADSPVPRHALVSPHVTAVVPGLESSGISTIMSAASQWQIPLSMFLPDLLDQVRDTLVATRAWLLPMLGEWKQRQAKNRLVDVGQLVLSYRATERRPRPSTWRMHLSVRVDPTPSGDDDNRWTVALTVVASQFNLAWLRDDKAPPGHTTLINNTVVGDTASMVAQSVAVYVATTALHRLLLFDLIAGDHAGLRVTELRLNPVAQDPNAVSGRQIFAALHGAVATIDTELADAHVAYERGWFSQRLDMEHYVQHPATPPKATDFLMVRRLTRLKQSSL